MPSINASKARFLKKKISQNKNYGSRIRNAGKIDMVTGGEKAPDPDPQYWSFSKKAKIVTVYLYFFIM
jgi:hypothetical protein